MNDGDSGIVYGCFESIYSCFVTNRMCYYYMRKGKEENDIYVILEKKLFEKYCINFLLYNLYESKN